MKGGTAMQPRRAQREGRSLPLVQLGGKGRDVKVPRYRDVLDLAYRLGFVCFEQAAPVQVYLVPGVNGNEIAVWVSEVYAVFRDDDGTLIRFHGVGDASVENANRGVAVHAPRLAHTRAKARALADALNLDVNVLEEFGGEEDDAPVVETAWEQEYHCSLCGKRMSKRSAEYSLRVRNALVCYECAQAGKA